VPSSPAAWIIATAFCMAYLPHISIACILFYTQQHRLVTGSCRFDHITPVLPKIKTKVYGNRSFAVSGPVEWNKLPSTHHDCSISLSTFKKRLKTSSISVLKLWAAKMRALGSLLAF